MTSRARSSVLTLAVVGLLWWLAAASGSAATTGTISSASSTLIGTSVQGRPIEVGCLGSGEHTVLVVGGLHTGPEAHSTELVLELARLVWTGDLDVPPSTQLCLLPVLNPDGLISGQRTNARGVDLNRNWPALNWHADAYHPEGGAVSGGAKPLSEPETRALWDYVLQTRPSAVLVLHCCGAVVEANDTPNASALAAAYGGGAAMQHIAQWTAYEVSGQFIDAMERIGIAAIDVEMRALDDIALESHRAGLERLIGTLAVPGEHPLAPQAQQAASTAETYRVQPGDTLANIASRYGTTAIALASINQIARPELIEVGQVLALPD